jgi:hypothetical protein
VFVSGQPCGDVPVMAMFRGRVLLSHYLLIGPMTTDTDPLSLTRTAAT